MTDDNYLLQDQFLDAFFTSQLKSVFYLTGGTALARFYFHHRKSIDLDLFTNQKDVHFDEVNREVLRIGLNYGWELKTQVSADAFLQYIFLDTNGIQLKIDIVRDIPVHFGDIKVEKNIRIDALENIGSNKITAILGRTDAKDYIDLYWILLKTDLTFDKLFELAKKKDAGLSELYFSYALAHIRDVTVFPVMVGSLEWEKIVDYFIKLSEKLLLRVKPKA